MRLKGNPPTEQQLRHTLRIPDDAQFLGWGVFNPDEQLFLVAQRGTRDVTMRAYGAAQDALQFSRALQAAKVVCDLKYASIVAASFFHDGRLAIVRAGGNARSHFQGAWGGVEESGRKK